MGAKDVLKIGLSVLLGLVAINLLWTVGSDIAGLISLSSTYLLSPAATKVQLTQQFTPVIKRTVLSIIIRLILGIILALIIKSLLGSYLSVEDEGGD